jgi:predicted negative regulator of RcsB-dependent stress response|tara:strand:- start:106 stop:930 length:825 start_codon:yes stop_codon:yes gene_type:complete
VPEAGNGRGFGNFGLKKTTFRATLKSLQFTKRLTLFNPDMAKSPTQSRAPASENLPRKLLLQPDRFEQALYQIADQAYRKRKQVTIAAVSVAVLVVALWGWWEYSKRQGIARAELYFAARQPFSNASLGEQKRLRQGIAGLEHFLEEVPNVALSVLALLELGASHARLQNWEDALQIWQRVLSHPQSSPEQHHTARLARAIALGELQRWDEAEQQLAAISDPEFDGLRTKLRSQLALRQGDKARAAELLRKLAAASANSPFKNDAEVQLLRLGL